MLRTSLALALLGLFPSCIVVVRHEYPAGPPPVASATPSASTDPGAPSQGGPDQPIQPMGTEPGGTEPGGTEPGGAAMGGAPAAGSAPAEAVGAGGSAHGEVIPAAGDYSSELPRFAFTLEVSEEIEDSEPMYGFGCYIVPGDWPIGFYTNLRFTAHSGGYPDLTDAFPFNAFGDEVVDSELHAFLVNFGIVAPVVDGLDLFAGLGLAASETEVELRDPSGVLGDDGRYYQRIDEDEDLNFNVGALVTLGVLALDVQWDSAFEAFSFGVGIAL